jgi:hypothetical protein
MACSGTALLYIVLNCSTMEKHQVSVFLYESVGICVIEKKIVMKLKNITYLLTWGPVVFWPPIFVKRMHKKHSILTTSYLLHS